MNLAKSIFSEAVLAELKNNTFDPSVILTDPLNQRVLSALADFSHTLSLYGVKTRICSRNSLFQLQKSSVEKKIQICQSYETWNQWFSPKSDSIVEEKISPEIERSFLEKALRHCHIRVADDFWKYLDQDLVVEIYGEDMVQLYRSISFYDVTGYSLLDLSLYEWYVLWERPRVILNEIARQINEVTTNYIPVKEFSIPKHVLREVYNTGKTEPFVPKASIVEFSHIASLVGEADGALTGFICTARGGIIAEGEDALSINFV